MPQHMNACRKCGCTNFYVHEAYVWAADVDDESGTLMAHRPSSEIEAVACQECSEEYDAEEFKDITFC